VAHGLFWLIGERVASIVDIATFHRRRSGRRTASPLAAATSASNCVRPSRSGALGQQGYAKLVGDAPQRAILTGQRDAFARGERNVRGVVTRQSVGARQVEHSTQRLTQVPVDYRNWELEQQRAKASRFRYLQALTSLCPEERVRYPQRPDGWTSAWSCSRLSRMRRSRP
jgi:hypothetical protein